MAVRVFLIRHGQTDANLKKRYCGFLDAELNDEGRRQAALLGKRLAGERIQKVYASDRKRAIETAQIVFGDIEIQKKKDLREINFGCFEGLSHAEILERYADVYNQWLRDPCAAQIPGGERLGDFAQRVTDAFTDVVGENRDRNIAVVAHGGALSILINGFLKTHDFWGNIPESASLSIIEYNGGVVSITLLNDTSHLHLNG